MSILGKSLGARAARPPVFRQDSFDGIKRASRPRSQGRLIFSGDHLQQVQLLRFIFSIIIVAILSTGANAQSTNQASGPASGTITGRVVSEDGEGLSNVSVYLMTVGSAQPGASRTNATDEDGNFRFTGLPPRSYSINANRWKAFVPAPLPASERMTPRYHRIGENVTITMIRGGVITGRVTTATGDPVIGIQVGATLVRDAEGNPMRAQQGGAQPRVTDDRGIYRLFGLAPGTYIVVANAGFFNFPQPTPYDGQVPVYYPSSTRDTAAEVNVTGGGEATGIDIRYRDERGHVVSGKVARVESQGPTVGAWITLYSIVTGFPVGRSFTRPQEGNNGFAIYGIPDGEYEIIASQGGFDRDDGYVSQPQRVTIKGSDVTGIDLKMFPMASISGKVVLEAAPSACESKTRSTIEEVLLSPRRDERTKVDTISQFYYLTGFAAANEKGEFTVRNLRPDRYFIEPRLPNELWYVKSIVMPAASAGQTQRAAAKAPAATDVSRAGFNIKHGDKMTGVTLTIADGAATVRGKVVPEKEGASLPNRLRVHLAPAEATSADEALRYAETPAGNGSTFSFSNLAPGKYWLIARPVPADEYLDRPPLPVAWDGAERAKLRKEAETRKVEIELKPCQRLSDQVLKY